ncbi:MAG: hypothetical protein JXA81_01630 [Sedimentisphaerales bacterium]|nr:hypothetical protein [Sedimentisphaerales bacterium]
MATKSNVMKIAAILIFFAVFAGSATAQESGFGGRAIAWDYIYVDAVHGNDNNEGSTPGTAFATIRKGIEAAVDGDTVLVYPGIYQDEINFLGKALVVQGVVLGAAGIPVLENPDDYAVSFYNGEGPDSVLKNFIIKNNFMAIFIAGSSPTLSNLTIVDNLFGIEASDGSDPDISNIIFWNNIYSDLFGCQAQYSRLSDASEGRGNIDIDPLFVDPDNGDYHLRSNRGRYWPEHDVWVLDRLTSPCLDGGDPNAEVLEEPIPNGNRINMGAYGGTAQASLSPYEPTGLPSQAFNPSPADGDVEVDLNVILRWIPGGNASSHDVYFGRGIPGQPLALVFMGNQTGNLFDPGMLAANTTYFWRIDEVNANGKRTGVLWKFTTGASTAPPPKGRTCFVAETDVWVDGALVSISKVAQGQINCGEKSFGKVQEVQEHQGTFECYDVLLKSGNSIGVAGNHYFLTESGQWLALRNLKAGTKLQTPKGSIGITSVTKRPAPYIGNVYNLNIAGSDRYLVGKDAIIVRDY